MSGITYSLNKFVYTKYYLKTGFTSGRCQGKRHNQAKELEKEGFISCSKYESIRALPQSSVPEQQYCGIFKLGIHAYSYKDLGSACIFMKSLVQKNSL